MSFFATYPALGGGGSGGGITSINGDSTAAQVIAGGTGISVATVAGTTTITNTSPSTFTPGNLTDVGTDGITITGGTNAINGAGTTISQHVADSTHNGYLSSTDWSTFNNKQSALSLGNLTDAGTDGIVVTGGTGAVVGSGTSIAQHVADSTHNGYLSSTDWSTFNNKQSALTLGDFTDAGTDGITVTGGTGAVVGAGTSISQRVADSTHNGYLSSADWVTFNGKGAGTVTSVSVTTANGVSGSVATATTTPAISLTLGAITPSSVAASGTVSGSNLTGTNTGDQTITLTGDVTGTGVGSFVTTITPVPSASVYAGTNQTGLSSNVATKVSLDTEEFDVGGYFDSATNFRYTPLVAGKYLCSWSVAMASSITNGISQAAFSSLYKNGSAFKNGSSYDPQNNANYNSLSSSGSALVDFNGSTDYVEVFGRAVVSSGTWTILAGESMTFFTVVKVSN